MRATACVLSLLLPKPLPHGMLTRAHVRADADVYLLDDPLSAVDAHVGQHLMAHAICGLLRSKTRVLVTHQLQFLPSADLVAVMRDGRIDELGGYQARMLLRPPGSASGPCASARKGHAHCG